MKMHTKKLLVTLFATLIFNGAANVAWAAGSKDAGTRDTGSKDITELSLEDLMDMTVTSVSKRNQSAGEVSAALFVLNHEDIHRSGATTIPELLRLVPGLHVAQIDGNRWAITARGSNSLFANKLLVLIDGRSVYTPLFSGVYWDAQDTMIDDIERIEVIRGPGASVWGANAVNGVINVITKNSKDTVGGLVTVGGGSEEQGFANVRYGEKISESSNARVYAKYFDRDRSARIAGDDAYDQWNAGQGGARFDWAEGNDSLNVQGDLYKGRDGFKAAIPSYTSFVPVVSQKITNYDGNNILAHWQHNFEHGQKLDLQTYYDKTARDDLLHSDRYETLDFDAQYFMPITTSDDLMFGVNYRNTSDFLQPTPGISFGQDSRTTELYSGFIQNESKLWQDSVRLTLGSKFEHNSFTGFEYQPTARIAWLPSSTQTVWGAFSRAVRTPSRVDDDVHLLLNSFPSELGIPASVVLNGSHDSESEILNAFELGYRSNPIENYSFDIATFYNRYNNVSSSAAGTPFVTTGPRLEVPYYFANQTNTDTYGLEILNTWKVSKMWMVQGWYSWQTTHSDMVDNGLSLGGGRVDPHNQALVRSLVTLPGNIDLDCYLRYLDSIPSYQVDAYMDLTLRVAWHYTPTVELAIVGANLLHDQHREYLSDSIAVLPADIQRSVYGTVTIKF